MKLKVPLAVLTTALVHACPSGISRAASCYDIAAEEFDTDRGFYLRGDVEWLGARIGRHLLRDEVPVCDGIRRPDDFPCPAAEPFATLYRRARANAPIPFERDDTGRDDFDCDPWDHTWETQFRVCGPSMTFACAFRGEVRIGDEFYRYDNERNADGFVTIGGERLSDFIIRKFQEALDASE